MHRAPQYGSADETSSVDQNAETACGQCGAALPPGARFCSRCGVRVIGDAPEPPTPPETANERGRVKMRSGREGSINGERKLITALIADIKDSVGLVEALGSQQAHRLVHDVLKIMVDATIRFGGKVLQPTGDGIYAVFGAPVSYADHAQRAIHAALQIQRDVTTQFAGQADPARRVEVRIGIQSGEVVLSDLDVGSEEVFITVGHAVNLAARLQTISLPGAVSVGDQTRRLIDGYFDLRPLPPTLVKGVSDPVVAHEVVGLGRLRRHAQLSARRELTTFVGRTEEMLQLREAEARTRAGRGELVFISGDAGSGKSRLLLEFLQELPSGCPVMEAHAESYGRTTPWLPVVAMLQRHFGFSEQDDAHARRCKLSQALAAANAEPPEHLAFLEALLGVAVHDTTQEQRTFSQMDPRIRLRRTADAVCRVIHAASVQRSAVLVFEDLHWADDATHVLLQHLSEHLDSLPVLVLITCRSGEIPSWISNSDTTWVRLRPLASGPCEQILSSLVGEQPSLAELKRLISDKAGGNPFFLEEIVSSLFDDGSLTREDRIALRRPLTDLDVPLTVHGTLAERIDQLAPVPKEFLQLLSVIGQTLPADLVMAVSPWSASETERIVTRLQAGDFIHARSDRLYETDFPDYAFKHGLIQEVAYHSMLDDRRKALHRRVGDAIESLHFHHIENKISVLAYHFTEGDDHPRAVKYLGMAAEQAVQRAAHRDALTHLREAIRRLDLAPKGAVPTKLVSALWSALGVSLQVTEGYASKNVLDAYQQAVRVSVEADDQPSLIVALRGCSLYHNVSAEYDHVLEIGARLTELGAQDLTVRHEGHVASALACAYLGNFASSKQYFSRALGLELDEELSGSARSLAHPRVLCLSYFALALLHLGEFDRALELSQQALAMSETYSVPITSAQSYGVHGVILHKLSDRTGAQAMYDRTISVASTNGLGYWHAFASMLRASLNVGDDIQSDLAEFESCFARLRAMGVRLGTSWYLTLHSDLLARAGRFDDAMERIREALAFIEATDERMNEALVKRQQGSLTLASAHPDDSMAQEAAEACFRDSLGVARAQGAKLWELRSAISLAPLYERQDRAADGVALLTSVLSGFDCALETADLIEARRTAERLRLMPF